MNEKLMDFLLSSEISKLPEEKKKLYQFIVNEEDQLADNADTPDKFLKLLAANSPYKFAADYFNLPYDKVFKLMNTIEEELNERVEARYKKVKWICYTDYSVQSNFSSPRKYVYLFLF